MSLQSEIGQELAVTSSVEVATPLAHQRTSFVSQAKAKVAKAARSMQHQAFVFRAHDQLMGDLLEQVVKVDFRQVAGFDPDDEDAKLRKEHYHIIICEEVLRLATQNQWALCQRNGSFYLYNGSYWEKIDRDELKSFLQKAAEKMGADKFKARHFEFADQLFKQFMVTAHLPSPKINRQTVHINLTNGTLRIGLDKQTMHAPDPADFMTYQLPFAYDDQATAPRFQAYLDKVLPSADLQAVLAEGFGYIFIPTRRLKLEKMLLLLGEGANGKSVAFDILTALLGPENLSSYSLEKITTEETYRAKIADKLVNYCSEISVNLEADTFKALVSGEPVAARELYGKPFQIENYAKLIANANQLPTVSEHTNAWFRRFLIVPFGVTILEHEQDKQLASKIIGSELPGVLNWILAGLRRLLHQGHFTPCQAILDQTELYKQQSDTVRLFLDEYKYTPNLDYWVTLLELYREYKAFCQEDGHRQPVAKLKFRKRLETFGIQVAERNVGRVVFVQRPGLGF